jgi:hypothetical protein
VNAYDAKDGTLLWSDVLDFAGGFDEAVGSVAFHNGQVFAHGVVATATSLDLLIRAYDPATGQVLWQDQTDVENGNEFPPGLWRTGLAADHGRATIVGSTRHQRPDGTFDLDWVVRTYDAGDGPPRTRTHGLTARGESR